MSNSGRRSDWHILSPVQILDWFGSTVQKGLGKAEIEKNRSVYGVNELKKKEKSSFLKILLSQFTDFLVMVLLGAALISGYLGELPDTVAIILIVLLNAILGAVQEYRAEKALEALQSLSSPWVSVVREGQVQKILTTELVPGDLVNLVSGDLVPADMRILESHHFRVDESLLTGESLPVEKNTSQIELLETQISSQSNMLFKGTLVSSGRAVGLVVRTGMDTELGKIAHLLNREMEVKTPLQVRMGLFAKRIAFVVLALCAVIFVFGVLRGEKITQMLLTALSLAVAAIPEALPAVMSVSLALGAKSLVKQNALIRKLPAVEALGSVTVICTDKTGTLTLNRMKLVELSSSHTDLLRAISLNHDVQRGEWGKLQGEATEIALVEGLLERGFNDLELRARFQRKAEIPFSSETCLMLTLHETPEGSLVTVKGAPEKVAPICRRKIDNECSGVNLEEGNPELLRAQNWASQGYRVIAYAQKILHELPQEVSLQQLASDLDWIGMAGLIDPPRDGVRGAIEECHSAGVRVVMITGDHPETARAIARQVALGGEVISGAEWEALSPSVRLKRLPLLNVFARVSPQQKIEIVELLQKRGEVVAMIGDGVNDAPALRRAQIGVAMGKGGTDVAREAAQMTLLDDRFATIVAAIREGRRVYDNIRKFVRFALSGNSGELWTLFAAPFFGLPTPFLAIHILWVNLLTDGLPGIAITFEKAEPNVMNKKPRPLDESIFAQGLWQHVVWVGVLIAALTLGMMIYFRSVENPHGHTIAFTVLTFSQMAHVFAVRSEWRSVFSLGFFSNLYLIGAVLITIIAQILAIYWPPLQNIFKTHALSIQELMICLGVSSIVLWAVELEKIRIRVKT
jgi:Ca2+-transporting ATPase